MASEHKMMSGICPDEHCQTKLYFPSYDTSIECPNCGQRHPRGSLRGTEEVRDAGVAVHSMLRTLLVGNLTPKRTTDSVKVLGLSNYHCKLLSPLLTRYGMDKQGKAVPLRTLNQGDVFNCALLASRAFLIQPEHIEIMGYGRDQTGSARYLEETLGSISRINDGQEVLIPIHADGDGHCLVHGISRALVGRELFWHALRTNLRSHFQEKLDIYKAMFQDFVDSKEWDQIIAESDPDFVPGPNEVMGLQNIHIFGLANVLHRPIILLDSLSGLQSAGDYTGVFLPALVEPESCRTPDGSPNKPLCVAWSSSGRNHFIALVGVKGRPLPKLPRWMLTRVWGAPQSLINKYIEFNEDGTCTIGGDRSLQDKYIQRLASAMEVVFQQENSVHPSLVADVHHYIYKRTGIVGLRQDAIIAATQRAVADRQLYSCLLCNAVSQFLEACSIDVGSLRAGGAYYNIAKETYSELRVGKIYAFPTEGLQFSYDPVLDELVPDLTHTAAVCSCCQGKELRLIRGDGSVVYHNGDKTGTPAPNTKCSCGYKHFWDGQEYDNMPIKIPVPLNWKNKSFSEDVVWFQNESDPSMNSNAYEVASGLVQKHFPTDFGSKTLVKQVVDILLEKTAQPTTEYKPPSLEDMPSTSSARSADMDTSPSSAKRSQSQDASSATSSKRSQSPSPSPVTLSRTNQSAGDSAVMSSPNEQTLTTGRAAASTKPKGGSPKKKQLEESMGPPEWNSQQSSKIILSGASTQSIHKEELTLSNTERATQQRIATNAPLTQRRSTPQSVTSQGGSPSSQGGSPAHPPAGGVTLKKGKHKPGSLTGKNAPAGKRIRLTTSDGRQLTLTLENTTTYAQLQGKINQELQIPIDRQKIKYGFPPKELRAPVPEHENDPLPLNHGDRITVEIIQDISDFPSTSSGIPSGHSSVTAWSKDSAMQEIKRTIARIQESAGDDLEIQLTSQTLVASLRKISFWEYVRGLPAMFEKGGLFYRIVERDLGLTDKNHCMLPGIKEHRFCYNQEYDRIELCLEPLGHFPVSPDVEKLVKFKDMAASDLPPDITRDHRPGENIAGSSSMDTGPHASRTGHRHSEGKSQSFPGQGHTLINEDLIGAVGGVDHGTGDVGPTHHHGDLQAEKPDVVCRMEIDDVGDGKILPAPGEGSDSRNAETGEVTKERGAELMDTRDDEESEEGPVAMGTDAMPPTELVGGGTPMDGGGGDSDVAMAGGGNREGGDGSGSSSGRYVTKKLGPGYTVLVEDDNKQEQ